MSATGRESDAAHRPAGEVDVEWLLDTLVESSDLVLAFDVETTITWCNPACTRILGHAPDQVIGQSIAAFIHPDDVERAAEVVGLNAAGAFDEMPITPAVYRVRRADGTWENLELNGSAGPDGGMLIVARVGGDLVLNDRLLEAVTAHAPFEEQVSLVMEMGTWRHPREGYAILYRGNHQARLFEQQLRNHKIPYAISGGRSFFENAEIKDLCAYLRLIANEDDDLAFIRAITVPRRGIGAATIESLSHYASNRNISLFTAVFEEGVTEHVAARQLEGMREFCHFINRITHRAPREPAGPVINDLLKAIGYEAWLYESCEPREAETKWSNVSDFTGWLVRKGEEDGKTLTDMIQTISLITMLDKDEEELDQVQLATLHASKGLEFKHVFLVGVEEGLLPHQSSIDEDKIEEERRLMYVGITRAQRSLTISYCERRKAGREVRTCDPSRFIDEMGMEGIRRSDRKSAEPVSKEDARARIANLRAMLGNKPGTIG